MIAFPRLKNGGPWSAVFLWSLALSGLLGAQTRRLDEKTTSSSFQVDSLTALILDDVRGDSLLGTVRDLASGAFQGRATGSEGFERAAAYVAGRFAACGFGPVLPDSTFLQHYRAAVHDLRERIHIDAAEDSVTACNVVAVLPGTDSLLRREVIVVTAHLDHLGRKGDSIFYGANDNASGVAVLLHAASFLASHRISPRRSIALIAFSGEEAGLLGSGFFVSHPWIDLSSIRLLINLDLVGSGKDGLMLQGLDQAPRLRRYLEAINAEGFRFELGTRPNSPNSDQYFFGQRGIPAVFLYAYNGTVPYHSVQDTWDKLDPIVLENVAKFVLTAVLRMANGPD